MEEDVGEWVTARNGTGERFLVSLSDVAKIINHPGGWYILRRGGRDRVYSRLEDMPLTKFLVGETGGKVRHINGNPLDCRRSNLKYAGKKVGYERNFPNKDNVDEFGLRLHKQFIERITIELQESKMREAGLLRQLNGMLTAMGQKVVSVPTDEQIKEEIKALIEKEHKLLSGEFYQLLYDNAEWLLEYKESPF